VLQQEAGMARAPRRDKQMPKGGAKAVPAPTPSAPPASDRQRIVAAFMQILAERPIEEIGFLEISTRAGVSLATLRDTFGSVLAILAAHIKEVDRQVLAGGDPDMAEEPPRERLFDILMRRIEVLAPHRRAVRSLLRSAMRNPGLGFALNGLAVRSQQWMLTAADIDAAGPRGLIRAQGLALLFARVLRVWINDDDPGLARTMAELDRALARGQRWAGFLDDLCALSPPRFLRRSRRRRYDEDDEEAAAV
jgi:AcrR family transcriptional regulator